MSEYSITKLRGKWALTWRESDTGIRRRYSLGTDDRKEAERRAPTEFARLTAPQGTTVEALWEAYRLDRTGRVIASNMQWSWKALEARFAVMEMEDVTVADCRAHMTERRALGRGDGTIRTELNHLAIVANWAANMRLIKNKPYIERPSQPDPRDKYITRLEVTKMLEGDLSPHCKLAIRLLIGTGARIGAALELTWDRVDFERGVIKLHNPFTSVKRKGRATVPINGKLLDALKEAHNASLSPYVVEFAGLPVKSIKRTLATAGRIVGRNDVTAHMFRHSAAVWLAEDGHSMEEIAQFLGHSNSATTAKVYARYSPNHMRGLAQSLEV